MSNYVQTEFDLRLSREVSHARTYPQQEKEPESSTGIDPLSGKRCYDSPEMYTQRGLLRKMYQPCDLRGLPWSYKISARSGMWENFIVYPLVPVAALRIKGTESGSWPTPTSMDGKRTGKELDPDSWLEAKERHAKKGVNKHFHLDIAVQFAEQKRWPTPQASDHRDRGNLSNPAIQRRLSLGKQLNLSMVVSPTSGQLNPRWVEWLMGYPDGWTDLNSLETP